MSYLGLTVSSFALEAKEECTGHENPAFYSSEEPTIKEVLIVRLCTSLRASGRSRKKKSNFAGFSGANSQKKRPISREFHWNFLGQFCWKTIGKDS